MLLVGGLGLYGWCVLHQIGPALSAALAVLVTLLFYWVGWSNYQMVFFVLISYWAVSEWERFNNNFVLLALLVGYFVLLTLADLAKFLDIVEHIFYSNMGILLLRFLGGLTLVAALLFFSSHDGIRTDFTAR